MIIRDGPRLEFKCSSLPISRNILTNVRENLWNQMMLVQVVKTDLFRDYYSREKRLPINRVRLQIQQEQWECLTKE